MAAARIVHLSTVHHDWDNRITNKECRALAEAGFDTHLVISADHDRLSDGVRVHAIRRRGRVGRLVGSQIEAWWVLRRLRPDLLHIHDPELIPMAVLWGRCHHRPVVYDAHEDLVKQLETKPWVRGPLARIVRPLARWLVGVADRHCDGIVAVTEPIAATFSTTRRRGRQRPVEVVRNLPWRDDFVVADVAGNPPVAVYTGDLSAERGVSTMVEAIERVEGGTLRLAGRLLGDAAARVEHPQVDYLGLVPPSELPAIIAGARVGLIFLRRLPNYANSLPTKVFEYMASGVPFLATDFRAWEDLFGDADAGVFVDTDDPDAVGRELEALIDDPERAARLGANGRRAVEERFSFEKEAERLVALVNRLVAD